MDLTAFIGKLLPVQVNMLQGNVMTARAMCGLFDFEATCCNQGRIPDFGFGGAMSSIEGARLEAPQPPRVYGMGYRVGGVPLSFGPPQKMVHFYSASA